MSLQVDTTYSSLIVPKTGCIGCRVGDRRYHPNKSKTSSVISCDADECASSTNQCESKTCFQCNSRGSCCTKGTNNCAFNKFYGDGSSGNGTLFSDILEIGSMSTRVLLGAMHEESHNFELPYADGVFGLAFQKGACNPTCFPPLMDIIVNATSLQNVFSMCVSRYGGTLVLGSADQTLARLPYQYVDMLEVADKNRFIVPAMSEWKIGERMISVPGVTQAMWSTQTSDIGMSKTTFMALLEHLNDHYCHIPGLCSMTSWFRPQRCSHVTDEMVGQMPNITMSLTRGVSITLTAEDYLLPYKKVNGRLVRCVGFIVADGLAAKGIGLLLGSTVMRRYAVVYDREAKRVGLAPADNSKCGPLTGTDEGLENIGPPSGNNSILTVDSPTAPNTSDGEQTPTQEALQTAETCRAEKTCSGCARISNCSYGYNIARCVPSVEANSSMYPFCSGHFCACIVVGPSGWYVGLAIGILVGVAIVGTAVFVYRKRRQRNQYQHVQRYEEQDLETF